MAAPVDANRLATAFAALSTWTVPFPSGVVSGDLLICFVRTGAAATLTGGVAPSGWQFIPNLAGDTGDATDDLTSVFCRRADRTEGTSVNVSFSTAIKGAAIVWRITGAANPATRMPEASIPQYFTTTANTGNPAAISPTGGSKTYLFLACLAIGGNTVTGSAPPTGYSSGAGFANAVSTGGSAATNAGVCGCSKAATTATEDPGVFTHPAASVGGTAFVIAIHPAAPTSFGATSLAIIAGLSTAGYVPPKSLYAAEILKDGPMAYWRMDDLDMPVKDLSPSQLDLNGSAGNTFPQAPGLLAGEVTSLARSFSASFINRGGFLFPLNTFTLEFWIKRNQSALGEYILDQYNGGLNVSVTDNGTLALNKSYTGQCARTSVLKILDTNPHHVVITRDGIGGSVVFYLDGVSETPVPDNPGYDFASGANNGFFVGSQWGSYPFDGTLDELAVYSKVLSPTQVQNHYTIGITVPKITYYGKVDTSLTFSKDVQGRRQALGSVDKAFTFFKDVRGVRKTFSSTTIPVSFGAVISGQRKALGQVAFPIVFSKDVIGRRKTFGQLQSPYLFSKDVRGQRQTFGQTAFPLSFVISTAGVRLGNKLYGVIDFPIAFSKDVKGIRKTFGQTALPLGFIKDVKGVRKTFGKTDLPIIFIKDVGGRQNLFGQLSMQTLFGKEVAGRRKTFGQIAIPLVFSKAVSGRKQTFGQIAVPINTTILVSGFVSGTKKYGVISLPVIFGKEVVAHRKTFGQITAPFIFGSASQGSRSSFGKFVLLLDFETVVKSGPVGIHGQIGLPIIVDFKTRGVVMHRGIILNAAENIYLGAMPVLAVYTEDQKIWPS